MDQWQWTDLSPEALQSFQDLLVVLGIGLLLGLEREHARMLEEKKSLFAGVRTFPLVAISGYLALFLSDRYSIWIFVTFLLGVIALSAIAYLKSGQKPSGSTTEFSLMLTFLLGGLVFAGAAYLAVVIAVIVAALLSLKLRLHDMVQHLTQNDIFSILYFLTITALMLPVLPNEAFGPYQFFNPYKTWLVVAIFVGLNFIAYFTSKFLAQRKSVILTGILGGFASSTATTWFFSRASKRGEAPSRMGAAAIVLASSIMFPRLLIWLLMLNMALFRILWWQVLLLGLIGGAVGYWLSRDTSTPSEEGAPSGPEIRNPINLREALFFALIYLGVRLLVGYAETRFGAEGLLIAAAISGITDVDAITISMAQLEQPVLAGTAIILAALTNTVVKFAFSLITGSKSLKRYVSYGFIPILLAGILVAVYLFTNF